MHIKSILIFFDGIIEIAHVLNHEDFDKIAGGLINKSSLALMLMFKNSKTNILSSLKLKDTTMQIRGRDTGHLRSWGKCSMVARICKN